MSAIFLYAKSKSGHGPHEINIVIEDGLLLISCSCQAGAMQQLCWHVKGIIIGNIATLENQSPEQLTSFHVAQNWICKCSCAKDIQRLLELEQATAGLKIELRVMKEKIANGLMDGFPLSA